MSDTQEANDLLRRLNREVFKDGLDIGKVGHGVELVMQFREAALSCSAEPTKHEQVCGMLREMALAKPDMRLEAAASVLLGMLQPPTKEDIQRGQELAKELESRSPSTPQYVYVCSNPKCGAILSSDPHNLHFQNVRLGDIAYLPLGRHLRYKHASKFCTI